MLWWRVTGVLPDRLALQYLDGRVQVQVNETDLLGVEANLREQMEAARGWLAERPAVAKPGDGCAACHVRVRCDEGWQEAIRRDRTDGEGPVDAEVRVLGEMRRHGFTGVTAHGEVAVVWDAAVGEEILRRFPAGSEVVLRLRDAWTSDGGMTLEVKGWTEVVGRAPGTMGEATAAHAPINHVP